MTVVLVIPCQKYCICTVYIWFWPTLNHTYKVCLYMCMQAHRVNEPTEAQS